MGGPGVDVFNGKPGENTLIQDSARVADRRHSRSSKKAIAA